MPRLPGTLRSTRTAGPALGPGGPESPQEAPELPQAAEDDPAHRRGRDEPGTALWTALTNAGPDGVGVAELLALTGMTRPTCTGTSGRTPTPAARSRSRAATGARPGRRADGRLPGQPRPPRLPGRHPRRDGNRPPGRDGQ